MEKKWLYLGGAFLAGVVVTILVLFLIGAGMSHRDNRGLSGAKFFEEAGPVVDDSAFKVLQVIQNDAALVHAKSGYTYAYGREESFHGALYLIINDDNQYYYDDQILRVPRNKEVRQIGIYTYTAGSGYQKTVPIIAIYEK